MAAFPAAPNTAWLSVGGTATQVQTSTFPIPRGVWVTPSAAVAIGLNNAITFETGAATDGFPIPANTPYFIEPKFCADLSQLWMVAQTTANVWFRYDAA